MSRRRELPGPGRCPACGGDANRTLRKRGYTYVQCRGCRLARLDPLPGPAACARVFDASYFQGGHDAGYHDYLAEERHHTRNAEARLDQIAAAGVRAGALLEIGPAAGFAMARASARGFRVAGVDVSAWARAQAHARTGAPVSASLDEVPLPAGGFQAVLMLQVLEHAPDAPALLRRVGCLLAPGGVLLLETWDVESRIARWSGRHWQQVSPPSVLWLFGRRSIVRLLEAAGFAVERIETPGKLVGSGRPLYQLLAKLGAAGRRLFRLLDRIGLTRLPMRYRRKDLITVLARRVPAPDPAR